MTRTRWLVAWRAGSFLLLLMAGIARADMVLGVHPFKPATKLTETFSPLASYLSEAIGEPVRLRIAKDYQSHTDAIGRDEVDIAYLGPAPYVELVGTYGLKPLLARQAIAGKPTFHGKIFVRSDSPIRTLRELKGKRFAFGDPNSTMSHLVPRYMLWQAGIMADDLGSYMFLGDHVNVALAVLAGAYDAGAVKEDVYFSYEGRGLRAIATSAPISDHVLVASRKLSVEKVGKLKNILLRMERDPKGVAALQAMTPGVNTLLEVKDSDYDSLRAVLRKMQALGVSN